MPENVLLSHVKARSKVMNYYLASLQILWHLLLAGTRTIRLASHGNLAANKEPPLSTRKV